MIEFNNINEILYFYLKEIIKKGDRVFPRNHETKEILGATFRLIHPRNRLITIKSRKWNLRLASGEFLWHINGSNDPNFISFYAPIWNKFSNEDGIIPGSCYGNKLFNGGQWESLVELLKKDSNSRRAVVNFYNQLSDENISGIDIACITNIQFLVRDNKLHCITTMRSNDIIWGLCYDIFLVSLFQEILALELDLEVGWYQHNANSLHLYKRHYELAESIISENLPENTSAMPSINSLEELKVLSDFEKKLRLNNIVDFKLLEQVSGGSKLMAEALIPKNKKVLN